MDLSLKILRDAHLQSGNRLAVLLALLFLTGISDGITMALLYPALELVGLGSALPGSQGAVSATFHALFEYIGVAPTLLNVSLILIGAVLTQAVLFSFQNWLLLSIQKKYVAYWQSKLFSDFIGAEWSYFVSAKTGEMMNFIVGETGRLGAALFSLLQLMVTGIILGIYLVISLLLSWKLTLYLFSAGLILFACMLPIRRAAHRYGGEYEAITAGLGSVLYEMLSGAKFIKASAGESKAAALVEDHVDKLRLNLTWSAFLPTLIRSAFEFAGILIVLGALVYGLRVEQVSAAQLLVQIALIARLFPRLMQLQLFQNMLHLSAPAYSVLERTHAEFTEHRESHRSGVITDVGKLLPGDLRAEGLVKRYGEKTVIDNVDFVIPTGRIVGFVGPSGAGKSTLIDVIMGLVEPTSGSVSINGVQLAEVDLAAWRKKIGYVSQDTFLFHDTIANNIRWSAPDASLEAVDRAAKTAGLDAFVSGLPLGYDTIVGDRGAKLSGGQRQRISIARALVREPAFLILDEATSALDSLSEQEIMNVINTIGREITIIIVAHRLVTVRDAHIIFVLEHGKIVERGSWVTLSNDKALFHRLMEAQGVSGEGSTA